jgi:transcriptional regulator with XRE-family HTH domain
VAKDEAKSPSEAAGEELRRVRTRKGWNQQRLADRLAEIGAPIDRATISKIETGDRRMTLDEVFWFAYALNVSPAALMLPRPLGSLLSVAPTRTLATEEALDWLRGAYFAHGPELPDDEYGAADNFFFEERLEQDALAVRQFPNLSHIRDEATYIVRAAVQGNVTFVRDQLEVIQDLARAELRRLARAAEREHQPQKKVEGRKQRGQR